MLRREFVSEGLQLRLASRHQLSAHGVERRGMFERQIVAHEPRTRTGAGIRPPREPTRAPPPGVRQLRPRHRDGQVALLGGFGAERHQSRLVLPPPHPPPRPDARDRPLGCSVHKRCRPRLGIPPTPSPPTTHPPTPSPSRRLHFAGPSVRPSRWARPPLSAMLGFRRATSAPFHLAGVLGQRRLGKLRRQRLQPFLEPARQLRGRGLDRALICSVKCHVASPRAGETRTRGIMPHGRRAAGASRDGRLSRVFDCRGNSSSNGGCNLVSRLVRRLTPAR